MNPCVPRYNIKTQPEAKGKTAGKTSMNSDTTVIERTLAVSNVASLEL
jgi:hypothetical protein